MAARVAVLSDVHGNPWALRAVLESVRLAGVDVVVNCGDLVAGAWPTEVVDELFACRFPVVSVRGNGDRMVADAFDGVWDDVMPPAHQIVEWAAARLRQEDRHAIGQMPLSTELEVSGLGLVSFFHATPRSDEEILLPTSEAGRVVDLLCNLPDGLAVHGHSHLQNDRVLGERRLINAGSVGKPFDRVGAAWLLLGPDVNLRRTTYDVQSAARSTRRALAYSAAGRAVAEDFAMSIQEPPGRERTLEIFSRWEREQVGHLAKRSHLHRLDGWHVGVAT